MGSTFSCLTDVGVQHDGRSDRSPAPSFLHSKLHSSSGFRPSTTKQQLAYHQPQQAHKQSALSHAASASTVLHSTQSSISQPALDPLQLQVVEAAEKDGAWETEDGMRTTQPLASVDASLASSVACSPRHQHPAVLSSIQAQFRAARSRADKASLSFLSSSPSPTSAQQRIDEEEETLSKSEAEEHKEETKTAADTQQQHHRGWSDSGAVVIRSSPAVGRHAALGRRQTADSAQVKAVREVLQSPVEIAASVRRVLDHEAAPAAAAAAEPSACAAPVTTSPTSSPLSSPPQPHSSASCASSSSSQPRASASSPPAQPPSVHLTSINLRLHSNQPSASSPCPSPLDLSSSSSTASAASASLSQAPPLTPPLTPPSKPEILHQLDDVTVYRAIAAYHREHRDEGLGPSWWNAHALLCAANEREREKARQSQRVIRITEYRRSRAATSKCAAAVSAADDIDGLLNNPRTIVSFLKAMHAAP